MSRSSAALALLVAALTVGPAHARRGTNQLVRVLAPVHKQSAPAHPFVNVSVRFGQAADGTPADPSTFSARIGSLDVTDRFTPVVENGSLVGMQGSIEPSALRLGRRNRLRVDVRSVRRPSGR